MLRQRRTAPRRSRQCARQIVLPSAGSRGGMQFRTDNAGSLKGIDLIGTKAKLREQLRVVLAKQRSAPAMKVIGAGRKPHRQRAVARRSNHGMLNLLEEAAELQLLEVRLAVWLEHLAHRDPGPPQAIHDSPGRTLPAPALQLRIDLVVPLAASCCSREVRIVRPVGSANGA